MAEAPDWIAFQPARWIAGTAEMDSDTEYVFFRLVVVAYEAGDALIKGSIKRNSMRCKVTPEVYAEAIEMLIELEKVKQFEDGVFIPSVAHRLDDASARITARQRGAKIARRKRELKSQGKKPGQIELIISKEFPDDQSDNQTDDQSSNNTEQNNTIQNSTPPKGGEYEGGELELTGGSGDPLKACFDLWNTLADELSLPKVQVLSDKRKRSLKARLKECDGVEGWKVALDEVRKSDFLQGKVRGRDWKCDFDFLLQQSSFIKVMEGRYRNSKPGPNSSALQELENMRR